MKFRDLKSILEELGYRIIRQNKHYIFSNGKRMLTVPGNHGHDVSKGLALTILKRARSAA